MNILEKSQDMTKNKLNMLYFLECVKEPISEIDIARGMIENEFMQYFSFKQYLIELENSDFVKKHMILEQPYYQISERGSMALEFFSNKMMGVEKMRIQEYVNIHESELVRYKQIVANYKKVAEAQYEVEVKMMDNDKPFFSVNLEIPSKNICEKIIKNWNENPSKMYVNLMNIMVGASEKNDKH